MVEERALIMANPGSDYLISVQDKFGIIGVSKPIQDALKLIVQAAPTDLSVLITGDTGTGKEVFAQAIHGLSKRSKQTILSVNCGAIPETLLESELFGHEKGAFTGAYEQRKGFFEDADKGTIFLDEIGEMPLGTQVKLLRVLESGEFSRLGSTALKKVDVRIIAATNRNLEEEVNRGNFRQDLFFRLNNVHIELPVLRDHSEDIPLLIDYFAKRYTKKLGIEYKGASEDAVSILKGMPWNGNIRELKNLVETLITLEKTDYISAELLRKYIKPSLPPHVKENNEFASLVPFEQRDEVNNFELGLIFKTLLEIKSEILAIKRGLHLIHSEIEEIKETQSSMQNQVSEYEEIKEYDFEQKPEITTIAEMERRMIEKSLIKFEGNRRQAADALGISERTLYRKIQEYGLSS